MHRLELDLFVLYGGLFPIDFGPYREPHRGTKTKFLVTHNNDTALYAEAQGFATFTHLHRDIVEHKRHSPVGTFVTARLACKRPFTRVEVGISIGAFHTLAVALFLVVFAILLLILLAGEQTLVEVGNTHILERDIG